MTTRFSCNKYGQPEKGEDNDPIHKQWRVMHSADKTLIYTNNSRRNPDALIGSLARTNPRSSDRLSTLLNIELRMMRVVCQYAIGPPKRLKA